MPARQIDAVGADFDRRSPEWDGARYAGGTYHDHVLCDRKDIAVHWVTQAGPGRVLDVGCGAGQLLAELSTAGWTPTGCDLAFRQCAATVRRLGSFVVTQGEGSRLPFGDGSFGAVTALGYLEYTPDPVAALRELGRVTAPGGRVVVSAPNRLRLAYVLDPLGVLRGKLFPVHKGYRRRYFTARSLQRLLAQSGVAPVTCEGHAIGRFTIAGFALWSDERSISADSWLARRLPARILRLVGADVVAVACKA